jgi:hypothetical protein
MINKKITDPLDHVRECPPGCTICWAWHECSAEPHVWLDYHGTAIDWTQPYGRPFHDRDWYEERALGPIVRESRAEALLRAERSGCLDFPPLRLP